MKSKEKEKDTSLEVYTKLDEEEKEKTKILADDNKTYTDLKKLTTPTSREQAKIRRFDVVIPKLESRVLALPALITDAVVEYKKIDTEKKDIAIDITTIEADIKNIQTVDIPTLEAQLLIIEAIPLNQGWEHSGC
jgi:hypothetical protein